MPIHHVVLLKFRADAEPDAVARYVEGLAALPPSNPDITAWTSGPTVSPPFHNGDFDFGMACDLADEAALGRYMTHPAHRRLAPFLAPILDRQIAFDYTVQPVAAGPAPAEPEGDPLAIDGLRVESALDRLRADGLRPGRIRERVNPYWAEGFVLAHRRVAGTREVELVVSAPSRIGATDAFVPAPADEGTSR